MSAELGRAPEPVGWMGHHNFIVPPDIVPVRRVSPIPVKKRTLCRPKPDGEPVCRAGNREWFSDQLFADGHTPDLRAACGSSMTAHASCCIGLLILLAGQPTSHTPARVSEPLRMPAFVALTSGGSAGSAPLLPLAVPERVAGPSKASVVKAATPKKSATVAAVRESVVPKPFSLDEQSQDLPKDQAAYSVPPSADVDGGGEAATSAGSGGSRVGGNGGGVDGSGNGAVGRGSSGLVMSRGPYRLGNGIEPPRKIKDVAPIYPPTALVSRALGTVVIEAIVGADGKVHDAKVLHSIPALDQSALDAVRQWEFTPSKLNGIAVAVIVTVLVQFSIH